MRAMTLALHVGAAARRSPLLLRPWRAADMRAVLTEMDREYPERGLHAHPDTYRPERRGWTGPADEQEAGEWLAGQDRGWRDGNWLSFAVLEHEQPAGAYRLAGHVGLKALMPDHRVSRGESAEVSYWTAVAARGRGIASAALQTVTGWAFDSFATDGLRQVRLVHDLDNHASCRVAEKSGYAFQEISPAKPPPWFSAAHVHTRCVSDCQ
jgi:RimJ/RimL family protein N-acetyltransferase